MVGRQTVCFLEKGDTVKPLGPNWVSDEVDPAGVRTMKPRESREWSEIEKFWKHEGPELTSFLTPGISTGKFRNIHIIFVVGVAVLLFFFFFVR